MRGVHIDTNYFFAARAASLVGGLVLARPVSPPGPILTRQNSGTTQRLQAVSPAGPQVVWASGVGGTFTVTVNGGATWHSGVVPGAERLEFRDVQAISPEEAYLLAAGPGDSSRIYRTTNGGRSWTMEFRNQNAKTFYDCFAFWSRNRGITMSDAVDGQFPVIRTVDGKSWINLGARLPAAQPGEAAFAASGTCVATYGNQLGWIVTGGAARARVLRTTDGGNHWSASEAPIVQGTTTSGIFTVEFRDALHGILAGGDIGAPKDRSRNVAVSEDGGISWKPAAETPFPGAAYGLSYVHGSQQRTVVVTGPGGAGWSPDEGSSWHLLPGVKDYWAVAFASPQAGWMVGTGGRILKVSF